MIKIVTNKPNIIREKKDLLGVRQWIRGIESPRACRANPSGHRAFEPLRELVLMKRHGKSLSVQKLFVGEQFPLRPIHSLASRSHLLRLLLRHANESITHRRNPELKNPLFPRNKQKKPRNLSAGRSRIFPGKWGIIGLKWHSKLRKEEEKQPVMSLFSFKPERKRESR